MGSGETSDLARQVAGLGIRRGTALFVHSSIKAVGSGVRAEELIAALRAAVGEEGTLVFPTFTARDEEYFDPDHTPSVMGIVAEAFRTLPGVLRSRHPRHPVAAQGPAARELLEGHEQAIGPCGVGTPFERHARMGGQVLLIGVDLDTLTLLHTAEAALDLPYLRELEAKYLDAEGNVRHMTMQQAPGGHRGGVRRFEKVLRDRGLIRYGRIGGARTMLMEAGPVLDAMIELLREDPAAALCRSDYCPDCVDFKAKIRAKQLAELGAELCIVLPREPENPAAFRELLDRFGCPAVFGTLAELSMVRVAEGQTPPPPPDEEHEWMLQLAPPDLVKLEVLPPGYTRLVHAPLEAARAGIQPFYGVMYKQKCRDLITDVFVEDGLTDLPGTLSPSLGYLDDLSSGGRIPLGEGHAQLREIVSAMRMRDFAGRYHLIIPDGNLYAETLRLLEEFWALMP